MRCQPLELLIYFSKGFGYFQRNFIVSVGSRAAELPFVDNDLNPDRLEPRPHMLDHTLFEMAKLADFI